METPQFKDGRSERVYRRLHLLGPGPAAFFTDAYRMMEDDIHFATRSHLVGHLLRELEGSVRGSLAAATHASTVGNACGANNSAAKDIGHIASQLGFEADDKIEADWIGLAETLHGVAHRRGLRPPRPVDEALHDRWMTAVDVFDRVLDRFEGQYGHVFKRLDELLEIKQPTRAQLSEFVNTVPHTYQVLAHFFNNLDHPGWFTGLSKRGMFDEAPSVEEDPETGRLRLPLWPAAPYLKRMAKRCPGQISKILGGLRTNNPRALESAVEIVLELPRDHWVALVPTVEEWIPEMARFEFFGEGVVDLIVRLAKDEKGTAAGELLSALLAPRITEEELAHHSRLWSPTEPVPYALKHSADAVFEALARAIGSRLIDLIGDLLDPRLHQALASPRSDETGLQDTEALVLQDYSSAWLPNLRAVSPHDEGQAREFLVIQLRQVVRILSSLGTPVEEILESTGRRHFLLYRRLELDFMKDTFPPEDPHVRRALLDPRLFKEPEVRSEYADLLQEALPALTLEERKRVLSWVRSGIEPGWVDDPDERRVWSEHWERDWLHLVREHLDAVDHERLEQLLALHGEARDLRTRDRPIAMAGGWGSPLNQEQIRENSLEELRTLIASWNSGETPGDPSLAGLAREFSGAVRSHPLRYSAAAEELEWFPPSFVEALLGGLREALRDQNPMQWKPVLSLGRWIVNQPSPAPNGSDQEPTETETDFEQARKHLMWLLQAGLKASGELGVPFEERERVWALIQAVARDPNPTPEFESEWLEKGIGPHGIGLNTARPAAISSALDYLFWVNRSLAVDEEPLGMAAVPEVETLLAEHLDPSRDPSIGVRAVVGRELGRLIWFDPTWIEESYELLFPGRPEHSGLHSALFDGYLRYGWKSPTAVTLVPEVFEAAILRIGEVRAGEKGEESADRQLADHLMTLYWQGLLPLQGDPALLERFFSLAPPELRSRAIHFVGWALNRTEEDIDPRILERLRGLWEWRVSAGKGHPFSQSEGMRVEEWMEFGWWFASRAFDPQWAIPYLQTALRFRGIVEWEHGVVEYLADLVRDWPGEVIDTLALFDPQPAGEPWRVNYWLDHAKTILRECLQSKDPTVSAKTKEVINRWIARGHPSLMELLERWPGSS